WPFLTTLVARSVNSSSAPCTTLPLGSRTVTATVPSDPCCASAVGATQTKLKRLAAIGRYNENADLRDIHPPPAKSRSSVSHEEKTSARDEKTRRQTVRHTFSLGCMLY